MALGELRATSMKVQTASHDHEDSETPFDQNLGRFRIFDDRSRYEAARAHLAQQSQTSFLSLGSALIMNSNCIHVECCWSFLLHSASANVLDFNSCTMIPER